MKKTYELLLSCFGDLFNNYGFRIVGKKIDSAYVDIKTENTTTGIEIYYEYRDNLILIYTIKLDGRERMNYLRGSEDYFNSCDFNYIIESEDGEMIHSAYGYSEYGKNEQWLKDYFTVAYEKLIMYGEKMLQGDFGQFISMQKRNAGAVGDH